MTGGALNEQVERVQRLSLVTGVVATVACVAGAFVDPAQFFRAYLFAYLFLVGLALGSLALVMIQYLTGGAWGLVLRRIAEAQMKTLPLLVAAFIPLVFGLPYIYAWATVSAAGAEAGGSSWSRYLEPRYFCWRAAGYFAAWIMWMALLSALSRRQDKKADSRDCWKAYKLSGPGLVVLGVTLHFAAIDWIMSLQPGFTSTIFGPLVFSGQLLSAYALSVAVFCWFAPRFEFAGVVSSKLMSDLGGLLFTFVILWAYMAWFQFMLIWIADLPRGNVWYLVRRQGSWKWITWLIVLFHFAIPFMLLLFRSVKQDRQRLGMIAASVCVAELVFMYFQVLPVYGIQHLSQQWMNIVLPIGLGGIWFACFLWLLERRPLLPRYDLNYDVVRHLRELDEEEIAREEVLAHV